MTPRPTPAPGFSASNFAREARISRTATPPLPPPQPPQEAQIRVHCEHARFDAATRVILDRYGNEVRAFLNNRMHNRASMEEVFSAFSEDVWKGLPSFRFEGKVRSWLYAVARNALSRHLRSRQRWGQRHVVAELDELQSEMRRSLDSRLADHAQLQPVLDELPPEDRRLLEQRLLLSMAWRDIAAQQAPPARDLSEAELERESARLRKRYQNLVERLRKQLASSRASQLG